MELFEEIVLTVLMLYVGIKKAIALSKKIQENAVVFASRFEIEEKSRVLEIKKLTPLHLESKHGFIPNIPDLNTEISPKVSRVDISWPKDINEDDFKHLRIRTPSVPEIEEIISEISEEVSVPFVGNDGFEESDKSNKDVTSGLENSTMTENIQILNIPQPPVFDTKTLKSENVEVKEPVIVLDTAFTNESIAIKPLKGEVKFSSRDGLEGYNGDKDHKTEIDNIVIREVNSVPYCETKVKEDEKLTENERTISCALDKPEVETTKQIGPEINVSEYDNNTNISVDKTLENKSNMIDFKNKTTLNETIGGDISDSKIKLNKVKDNTENAIPSEIFMNAEEDFNTEEGSDLQNEILMEQSVSSNPAIESKTSDDNEKRNLQEKCKHKVKDEAKKGLLDAESDGMTDNSKSNSFENCNCLSMNETLANKNQLYDNDSSKESYFKTAFDSATLSNDAVSDTTCEVSSLKSSVDDVSDRNLNKDENVNLANKSLQAVNTSNLNENTIVLCSAKRREESGVKNNLVLCKNSAVIGNSDLGQTVHESSEDGNDDIYYNATSEVDSQPFWLIFSGEYTKAMNKDWHSSHFCCWQCDESLTGQRYVLRDDHPYCIKCYESVFANPCEECNKTIGIDSKDLSYKEKHWHEACFLCNKCHVSLVDKQFGSKADKIYCGNCYDTQFASRCDGCTQIFRAVETTTIQTNMATDVLSSKLGSMKLTTKTVGEERIKEAKRKNEDVAILSTFLPGQEYKSFYCTLGKECLLTDPKRTPPGTKKMEYKTRQWHEQCFSCCVCKSPIGTKSFIPREQEIYCATCYEEKFATRCVKCNKIITSGGVTYKNEPWHRECFTCTKCDTSLAGQRFTSRDEKPYCADCFGELFAKRCTACCKPITGIGGTRFISFEDRHWHNDCFICATCKTSLVGRGFITDGDDIICPDCAKAKLM